MHIFTAIYGEKYLPFLRVFLSSVRAHHQNAPVTVYWDDISNLELRLLKDTFADVNFVLSKQDTASAGDNNRRISMYLRHWQNFLAQQEEGVEVCLMDVDMLVMQSVDEILDEKTDVIFTWKVERFPINGGIVIARNNPAVRQFFDRWLRRTEEIMADEALMDQALKLFGAADQYAFVELLEVSDYTSSFVRDFGSGEVRFTPQPCALINETNCKPISDETKVFHLKSGWHNILLEDGEYTKWRTAADCGEVQRYWTDVDIKNTIAPWRNFVINATESQQHNFPAEDKQEYVVRGIINSEMLAFVSLVHELDIEVVVESGRYLGQSTKMLGEALRGTGCEIHSTELIKDEVAVQAEERLREYSNIVLHYGDAFEVIPEILAAHRGKRVAILLDGPKGIDAFRLLNELIAEFPEVVFGCIHDLRDSHPGMLNPNRVEVHEWFERIFFTDDAEFLRRFRSYDETCKIRGFWEPGVIQWQTIGSYGPTLGVILPTLRDRFRAKQRLRKAEASHIQSTEVPAPRKTPPANSLKKLHRIPGFTLGKNLLKRGLGRPPTIAPAPARLHRDPNEPNELSRKNLANALAVSAGDIVIDCGANVGQEVAKFADSGAMIYAFEPNPHAFRELADRFRTYVNVVCFPFAVLDRNTTIRLYLHEWSDQDEVKWSVGSSILDFKGNVTKERYVDVPAIDLSEFIFRLNHRVKLLKMDIEGAEYETLSRLIDRGLHRLVDYILVETHEQKIPELRDKHQILLAKIAEQQIANIDLTWI